MKYGVISHVFAKNIGDNIQSYAAKQFLPRVDYVIDREKLDTFESKENEPVATIMAHWYLWHKWNWPPSDVIIPKFVSMHISNHGILQNGGSPVKDEWLEGIGKDYLMANSPIGARDKATELFLKKKGIDSYFSGCITLTLPKQKELKNKGEYAVLVDLPSRAEKYAEKQLKKCGIKYIKRTHHDANNRNYSFDEKMKRVEELLTLYQNARFVITKRLHAALPCLAMEVPVLAVVNMDIEFNSSRWKPFNEWVRCVSEREFISGKYEFDFIHPPENRKDYLPVRERLIKDINAFVELSKLDNRSVDEMKKTKYTKYDVMVWQNDLMKKTLDEWRNQNEPIVQEYKDLRRQYDRSIFSIAKNRLISKIEEIRRN